MVASCKSLQITDVSFSPSASKENPENSEHAIRTSQRIVVRSESGRPFGFDQRTIQTMSDAERPPRTHLLVSKRHRAACRGMRRKTMIAKKIIITAALLLSATSAALAQSAWTTGTASDRERAGFPSPFGGSLYSYAPDYVPGDSSGLRAFARIPQDGVQSIDNPALTGGGSAGYNELERQDR
jgi:hypothetical protein